MKKCLKICVLFVLTLLVGAFVTDLVAQDSFSEVAVFGDNLNISDGDVKFVAYEDHVLEIGKTDFRLYTILANGDLQLESITEAHGLITADMYADHMIVLSKISNSNTRRAQIYDISDLANPSIEHVHYASGETVAILEDYYIIRNLSNDLEIYDLVNYQLTDTEEELKLKRRVSNSDYLILYNPVTTFQPILHKVSEEGAFVSYESAISGNVLVGLENQLIFYSNDIHIYEIGDTVEQVGNIAASNLNPNAVPYFRNGYLAFFELIYSGEYRYQFKLYDVSYLNNISFVQSFNIQPTSEYLNYVYDADPWYIHNFMPDAFSYNDYYYVYIKNDGLYRYSFANGDLNIEPIKLEKTPTNITYSNNKLYFDYINKNYTSSTYNIQDYNSITEIPHEFPIGRRFHFDSNTPTMAIANESEDLIHLYQANYNNEYEEISTLDISENIGNSNPTTIHKWDGDKLIFSNRYYLGYYRFTDGEFEEIYSQEFYLNDHHIRWLVHNNILYKISVTNTFEPCYYEILDDTIDYAGLCPITNTHNQMQIVDGLLTIETLYGGLVYDLDIDPIALSVSYDLSQWKIESPVQRYKEYYLYVGLDQELYDENEQGWDVSKKYLVIYQKNESEFVKVGELFNVEDIDHFDIIPISEEEFDIVTVSDKSIKLYSCNPTPNGDFEVSQPIITSSNYPNPFKLSESNRRAGTTISYDLPLKSNVNLSIYNIKGQLVKSLINTYQTQGNHNVIWNGRDNNNKKVASGTYFYKVKASSNEVTRKITMIK